MSAPTLRATFEAAGQGHVFQHYDKAPESERPALISQLSSLDLDRCLNLFKQATSATASTPSNGSSSREAGVSAAATTTKPTIAPLPKDAFESLITHPEKADEWRQLGLSLIRDQKVGLVLLAGGQGTRLGSADPKGMYDIGLLSGKSLFQLQAERLLRLRRVVKERFGMGEEPRVPWYVMTSGATHGKTVGFFRESGWFGLPEEDVVFFQQDVLPAFTPDGKLIMETHSKLSVAPDGNGGIYHALSQHGILNDMTNRGLTCVHMYCVDNCLVRVADPVFIGYCHSRSAACGIKTVPKSSPTEPVGVIALVDGKYSVLEYSEMSDALSHETDPDDAGRLRYRAANIANHYFTLSFLQHITSLPSSTLTYHIAHKKIKHTDLDGTLHTPSTPNGLKLELFIFDVLPLAPSVAVLEVRRDQEFSPLKNATGPGVVDSPETSREDVFRLHRGYLEDAGATVVARGGKKEDESALSSEGGVVRVEVSPLVSYAGEGLERFKGHVIETPRHVE